jgi:D-alanyl-D-alanine carboxypeptidase
MMTQLNHIALFNKTTSMKKTSTLFMIAGLLLFSSTLKAQLPGSLQQRLQFVLDSVCTKYKIKGATAAVLYPGAGTWKGAHGISYDNSNITTDMLMGIGSNTKTFISALVLKMQEQSLIDLDDSIGTWIHNKPNINGAITIRQCLNHTSGIFSYTENDAINDSIDRNPGKTWQRDELLALAQAPYFQPGKGWSYSNTNYIIAGIIIEQVLGKPVEQAMHEMILAPAGLNNTYFYGEGNSAASMPHQWSMNITGQYMTDLNIMFPSLHNNLFSMANTAGAMVSTAEDNAMFWHKLTTGQIINANSLKEMETWISIGSGDGYGLGMFFYSRKLNLRSFYSHGGTFFGFINDNMTDTTSGVCISVLTNQDSIDNNRLLLSVIGSLHKVTLQMPVGLKESAYNNRMFTIYPNPATDEIRIRNNEHPLNNTVLIYDMAGKLLHRAPVGYEDRIPVSGMAAGMYLVQVEDEKGALVHVQKLKISR